MEFKNIFTNPKEVETLKDVCKLSASILKEIRDFTEIGKTPKQINDLAEELCKKNKAIPAFKNNRGPKGLFPGALCVSVNEETLHTVPFSTRKLQSGDIVKLDFGIAYKGIYTDHCATLGLGELSKDEEKLIKTAKMCVDLSLRKAVTGNKVGDISSVMQNLCQLEGFDFVKDYSGHGIGRVEDGFWQEPAVPSYGRPGTGFELKEGMVLCIENQITKGKADLELDYDGWTLRTKDGSKSAMFEHMVLVTKKEPIVLTNLD